MKISREWAMPNRHTFLIKPIGELVSKYAGDGCGWADPFAGENSPAEFTNDLHPGKPTKLHLDAHDFAKQLPMVRGILFDPPYSLRQLKEVYESVGRTFTTRDGQVGGRWYDLKNILLEKLQFNGLVISCGWHSNGFGMKRGCEIIEILLVAHGSAHNDTIITVEKKVGQQDTMQFLSHADNCLNKEE